jgi:hypothetical protein
MSELGTAVLRKAVFIGLTAASLVLFDRKFLNGFDTVGVLKNDPKALAGLLAGWLVAVALA